MTEWVFCPKCATRLTPGASTCAGCGTQLRELTPTGDNGPPPDSPDLTAAVEAELREALAPGLLLIRTLGHGGMGTVYLARDPALKRNVVIKVLAPWLAGDPTARARFEREAQAAAAVAHPNVVSVFQVGTLPRSSTSYFVMQHVEGQTLEQAFPPGTMVPEGRAKRIIGEIAAALAAAHKQGLVHRDIKPANVMLEAETDRVVVLDFGISAAASPARRAELGTKLTQEGSSIGTPTYMSPEQAAGEEVTERSDVYSLGVLAFELLTGRLPFEETTPMALLAAHINKTPPPTASFRPDADPSLTQLVDECSAKDPQRRPSAADVAAALLPSGATPVEWPPPGLEAIHGVAARQLDGATRFAALAVFYAFLTVATVDDVTEIGFAVLMFLGSIGAVWYAFVLGRASRHLPRGIVAARRAGYPRRVVMDVMVDQAPDTELLLNRAGPFVRLRPAEVDGFLGRRRLAFAIGSVLIVTGLAMIALGPLLRLEDLVLLSPFALLAALVARWELFRPERAFRRRHLRRERARRDVAVGSDLVHQWVEVAGWAPAASTGRGGRETVAPRVLDAALAFVVAVGLLWGLNFVGVVSTLERDPPGDAKTHLRQLRGLDSLARIPFPTLDLDAALRTTAPPNDGEQVMIVSGTMPAAARQLLLRIDTLRFRLVRGSAVGDPAPIERRVGEMLAAWRRLASPELPMLWYRQALARITWRGSPNVAGLPAWSQRPRARLTPFATIHAAAALAAADDGDWDTARAYVAELVGIARNLARDPATMNAALGVLDRTTALLGELAAYPAGAAFGTDARRLVQYRASAQEAVSAFIGRTVLKAAVRPSRAESLFVALAGDTTVQPVFRRAVAQAAALGFCYSGSELFFGRASERQRLVDTVLARLGDLPSAPAYARLLQDVQWDTRARGVPGVRDRALATVFWAFVRFVNCDRIGLPAEPGAEGQGS